MSGAEQAGGPPDRDRRRSVAEILRSGLALAELSPMELWMDYVALGGDLSPPAFTAAIEGGADLDRREFDRAAAALNDTFIARGLGYRISTGRP